MATRDIKTTKDYTKFKTMLGNRPVDEGRIKFLVKLMKEHGNRTDVMPVIINKDGYVIDGQHRLEALKQLGWEVGYVVQDGNIDTVRVINQGGRNWGWHDIASSYSEMGNINYQDFLRFHEKYGFTFTTSLMLISNLSGGHDRGILRRKFNSGTFEVTDRARQTELGDQMSEIREIAGEGKNSEFYKAVAKIIQSPVYDHTRMIRKLKQAGHTLNMRDIASNYMRDLENLYNSGFADDNKVRLF